jgi:hypothetical protein
VAQAQVHCPLCNQPAQVGISLHPQDIVDVYQGRCDRCGYVRITQDAVGEAQRLGKVHILSAWFRRIQSESDVHLVKRLDVATIIADTPEYSVLEKLDQTLVAIAAKTPQPGQRSQFTAQNDYPLVYAANPQEVFFYISELAILGFVRQESGIATVLTPGFGRLIDMQKGGRTSAFVFVAMWFSPSMDDVYSKAIGRAVREAGYKPIRVDRVEHVNRIDDEIVGSIRASRFMVADFTGHRQGVYFEAGMMLGRGRTVIWMCKDEELAASHFDTRQYNFINYKSVDEA